MLEYEMGDGSMQNTFLTDEMATKELDDYINNVKINYATLINGSWGCGKTHFIKHYISEKEKVLKQQKDKKSYVYISLYGMNNISEIRKKLLLSMIKSEKLKKLKPLLDLGIEIGSEYLSDKTFIRDTDKKLNNLIDKFININNAVIFFDDLERCDISINLILGFINELVEHNNVKAILIADEDKIGKINFEENLELKYITVLSDNLFVDSKENVGNNTKINKEELEKRVNHIFTNNGYNGIKEKLIGKVIHYRANLNKLYDVFVKTIITNSKAKNTAIKNKEKLLNQLGKDNHFNLRTIQFIFQSFNRLVLETIKMLDKNTEEKYMDDLFSYICIKSIHIKKGDMSYNWETDQLYGTVYLGDTLRDYIYNNFVTGFRFVDDYLMNSVIDKKIIKETIEMYTKNLLNEIKHPNDPIYKLRLWWLIPEDEMSKLIDELMTNINSNVYDLEVYSKIVSTLSKIEEMNLFNDKIEKTIKQMEENISNDIVNGHFIEDTIIDMKTSTTEIYKKNIKNIKNLANEKNNKDIKINIDKILKKQEWGSSLKEFFRNNEIAFYNKKSIIHYINLESIVNNIINKSIEEVYEFWYLLQKVLDYLIPGEYYDDNIAEIKELNYELKQIKDVDGVKKYAIKLVTDYVDERISSK